MPLKKLGDWLINMSLGKLTLVSIAMLLLIDIIMYYISGLFGRSLPPYPLLRDIFDFLKSIKFTPVG